MMAADIGALPVSLAEAQAFARVETGEEEALLAGLLRSATGLCEAFTGQLLMARGFEELLPAGGAWQRLGVTPVRAIETVERVAADGSAAALLPGELEVDIDSRGDGWVKISGEGRVRVRGQAGLAGDANGVPEPLRQGILRLTAHFYANRDGEGGEPPAAVTALWRPYRRMRLA
jgi:uncharacterized phiE125 gp8 family phage protein